MISTKKSFKNNVMTPTERKSKVLELKKEHEDYFNDNQVRLYSRLTDSVLLLILLFILPIIFI